MAIPASEQWTALFLPQLLFAADPERLYSGGPAPRALLIEDRIAARNREAVRLGVRRCMNAKEALLQTPALQLERSGQLVGQELSSILLSIAQSFGAALLLQAPNSGAAAIIVHADQSALQQLLDTVLRLKFEAFGGSGSSPQNALSAAVKEAQSVQADYDAQALLMHTVLKENLIAKPAPETFRLRIGVPSFNFKLQLERLEAAFAAWTKTVKTNAVSCTIRAYDPVGRILHTSSVLGGNLLIPIGKSAAAGRIRLHKLLYKAVLKEQAANLELEVVPFRQTADGEAATSPLVRSLTQIVGRSRVYQLALTGDLRPEAAQQHVPALNLSGSAHQREPLPAYAHILQASAADLPPIEIFPEIQSLPASGGLPIFNGPLELLDGPKRLSSAAKDPRRYYRARSATGELLWIFQDLQNRRWFLQGRFA